MRAALIALATVGVLAAAGCARSTTGTGSGPQPAGSSAGTGETTGAGGGTTAPPGASTATSQPASGSPGPTQAGTRCRTPDLTGSFADMGAAAGHRYVALVLTNVSGRTCTLFGYGGIQLATASRQPLPTIQVRDPMHPPRLVRLAPGGKASAPLSWGVVASGNEPVTGPCEPMPSLLLVIPPDETTQLAVPWRFGSVCQHGEITQWAYAPGLARP